MPRMLIAVCLFGIGLERRVWFGLVVLVVLPPNPLSRDMNPGLLRGAILFCILGPCLLNIVTHSKYFFSFEQLTLFFVLEV